MNVITIQQTPPWDKFYLVAWTLTISWTTKKNTCWRQQPLGLNSYTNQARAKLKLGNKNWLSHCIGGIIICTYLTYLQFTLCNNVANIMVLDINVLCPLIEHLIFSKVYCTLAVTKQVNARIIFTKLSAQTVQPDGLFTCFDNSHAFSLRSRLSNDRLHLLSNS